MSSYIVVYVLYWQLLVIYLYYLLLLSSFRVSLISHELIWMILAILFRFSRDFLSAWAVSSVARAAWAVSRLARKYSESLVCVNHPLTQLGQMCRAAWGQGKKQGESKAIQSQRAARFFNQLCEPHAHASEYSRFLKEKWKIC